MTLEEYVELWLRRFVGATFAVSPSDAKDFVKFLQERGYLIDRDASARHSRDS